MKIKLPLLSISESAVDLSELGVPFALKDCEIKESVFYYSNLVLVPYAIEGKNYTIIYSGDSEFICPLTIKEVENIIDQQNTIFYAN